MKKIVFTGPECSGKTTLSQAIAEKFNLPIVEEYARKYLTQLKSRYEYEDLVKISKGQLKLEEKIIQLNPKKKTLICDTNLQVIKLWSFIKYSKCDSFILKNEDANAYYVLCYPDFNWEYDPLRENKNNRLEIFKKYHEDLINNKRKFIIASGLHQQRMALVSNQIMKMI